MKVNGTGAAGPAGGARAARPAGGQGFQLPTFAPTAGANQTTTVAATRSLMGMDALLAMQDIDSPTERKRRAVRRADRILDTLDEVKLAVLGGELTAGDLDRLRRAVRDERANTEDPGLEAVLNEVELRAAVELAKLEQAERAA